MKKATNKLMSFLAAFAMVLSVLVAPFTSANAAEETTNTVTLHKLVMSKDDLSAWDSAAIEKAGYNGTQNVDQLKSLLKQGHSAKEVAGVYFAFKYNDGTNSGKYVTIKEEEGKAPVYGAADSLDATLPQGYKLLAGETESNGKVFNTKGLSGKFLIEEIHEKSSYVGEKGEAITDSRAVPVDITLPLVNNDGVVKEAHVYPKNTEEKPKIDKNFVKDNGLETVEDTNKIKDVGAVYENYEKEKATAEAQIGKKVPYEVKTQIPANSNLAEAKWDDKMTEGLTYNKGSLVVKIGEETITPTQEELTETDNGFVLKLQGENLAKLNGKDAAVTVLLTYSATVNSKAVVDIPEANDVNFFYGNTPSKGTTPLPTKPNDNGEVSVKKTWDSGSNFVDGEWAKFKLVDANTGKDVTAADLVNAPADYKFEGTVTLSKGTRESYTWKYLNKDKQYKAIEIESKTLSDAEYTKAENGTIEVTNHKSNNPKPLNPTEPKVVLGGKKFVKTNQDGKERLAGAEFYVKKGNQYLVAAKKDSKAVTNAKTALDDAVAKYNGLTEEQQKGQAGTDAKAAIDTAQDNYNKVFKENASNYTWGSKDDANVVVLVSDGQGRFEITGLEYGDYKLEEKTEPKGYAKLSEDVPFKVAKGTYAGEATEFKYEPTLAEGETQTYGKQVINKKVTIPQTGGIGSLIFIVAGLALMGVAFVAMKRRNSYEEA